MLLAASEGTEFNDALRGPEVDEETDPWLEWFLGAGEAREACSLLLYKSLKLVAEWSNGGPSSTGGDDALLFCPAAALSGCPSDRLIPSSI